MAQFGESGLFQKVLRGGHAGSIAVPRATRPNGLQTQHSLSSIEAVAFTQSWIVIVQISRAGDSGIGKDTRMKLKCKWAEFAADESGATAIEYGLIAAGIALAIIEIIYALGTNLVAKLQSLATALK